MKVPDWPLSNFLPHSVTPQVIRVTRAASRWLVEVDSNVDTITGSYSRKVEAVTAGKLAAQRAKVV